MSRRGVMYRVAAVGFAILVLLTAGRMARDYFATRDLYDTIPTFDLDEIRGFLEQGGDPNYAPDGGLSPLAMALTPERRSVDTSALLLEFGADPNGTDAKGNPLLGYGITTGNVDLVRLMLERGADPDPPRTGGRSLVTSAVNRGNVEIVDLLLNFGSPCNANALPGTLPIVATVWEEEEIFFRLIERGCDEGLDRMLARQLLPRAVSSGSLAIVRELVARGADPFDTFMYEQGFVGTYIHAISPYRGSALLDYFIGLGLDLNALDSEGRTPLDVSLAGLASHRHVGSRQYYLPGAVDLFRRGAETALFSKDETAAILWVWGVR